MERKHSTSSLVHYSLTYAFESKVQYYAHIFLILYPYGCTDKLSTDQGSPDRR